MVSFLRWGYYCGVSRWAQNAITCVFIRGIYRGIWHKGVEESNVNVEAEIGMVWLHAKKASNHKRMKITKSNFFPLKDQIKTGPAYILIWG